MLDKRDLIGKSFIILNNPDNPYEKLDTMFNIDLTNCSAEDLKRYCTKLFYDQDIPVDYNKVIRQALAWYLQHHITDNDLKEIENIKAEELAEIERSKQKAKPVFDWDLSNKIKE